MTTETKPESTENILSHHRDFLRRAEQVYRGDILVEIFKKYTSPATWKLIEEERGPILEGQTRDSSFSLRLVERERIEDDGERTKYFSLSFPGCWVSAGPILSSDKQVIGEGLALRTSSPGGFHLNSPNSKKIISLIDEISRLAPLRILTRSPG